MPVDFAEVASNVFMAESELKLAAGFYLRANMTMVRRGAELWVHSPLPKETEWYEAADALGDVRVLVAPNSYHHLYIADAAERYPDAIVLGPAALRKKRKDLELTADLESLGEELPPGWPEDIRAIAVGGAKGVSEFLFYDASSKSLLVTDLLFNNERPRTWLTRTFVRLLSGWDRPSRSRIWRFLVKDRAAFTSSLEVLSELELERVLPAHGKPIEDAALAVSLIQTGKPPQ